VENPANIVAQDTKRPERPALSAILFPARLRLAEVPERELSTTKRLEEL
tara:strand:+ start:1450 stop:1596 length:147 start_codon:yes stop_codon:yes gene_type:complete